MSISINGTTGVANNSGTIQQTEVLTISSPQNPTFDIPSWSKIISIIMDGVGSNGTSEFLIQMGPSSGVETTGYKSASDSFNSTGSVSTSSTAGFVTNKAEPTYRIYNLVLLDETTNTWVGSTVAGSSGFQNTVHSAGSKSFAERPTKLLIRAVTATDALDTGNISIMFT